jgi:ATP-dependent DNA helicase RecG
VYSWTTNIRYVQGVGPVKAAQLEKLGIRTCGDLLEYAPTEYIYPNVIPIKDLKPGQTAVVSGIIDDMLERLSNVVAIRLKDDTGCCTIHWWNQSYIAYKLCKGMKLTVWGRIATDGGFDNPKYTTCNFKPEEVCGGMYGVHTALIRPIIREVLRNCGIPEWSNGNTMLDLWTRKESFEGLHRPEIKEVYDASIDRLKFDELLVQQVAVAIKRKQQTRQEAVVIEL